MKEDCAYVGIGALPLPIARQDEPEEPEQMVKLAGWAQITERRDTLADAVANTVLWWDGGKDWPTGEAVELYPDQCPIAATWVEDLEPDDGDLPPTVTERRLLTARRERDDPQLLHDPATAAPAVADTDYDGALIVTAACAQRIPTTSPLAEVILSHGAVWIRTEDGQLSARPERLRRRAVLGLRRRRARSPSQPARQTPRRHHRPRRTQLRQAARGPATADRVDPPGGGPDSLHPRTNS